MTDYIPFKDGKEIEWLELNLLKTGRPMSKAIITSLSNDKEEEIVTSWISELMLRSSILNEPYYEFNGGTISPLLNWEKIPEYFLCLYFDYFGASGNLNGTKLFEKISAIALQNFIGGEIYTLGFPSAMNLNSYLDEIADKCNEKRGIQAHSDYKDDGVDVICYKTLGDKRSSNLYVLLQCAAGIHWNKKKSIELDRWCTYIFWYRKNIITSISTVEYIQEDKWQKNTSDYGMILDRTRINNLYYNNIDSTLQKEVSEWCTTLDIV
ncbi:hypothetical protein FNO01nite_05010 [Flavobacterium noncentrifugens]|uniref:Uncharacterized protein n=1 Tax=Flavobacterium noncentrifugens TaxID=1128970 RepID=A0A1G8SGZ2_9FLAO|nr:hypothetical protein [Flavobacterium noncentrifugens]GEP49829.1 hypothetical protein FNO01nite_05010 [Flavobacterium noncentrifugens]SDJ28519.1 hypothetical protein SAMN04487935_0555 [Flavobacterium noncentrifugens]